RLSRMIEAQGGDPRICEDTGLLPAPDEIISVKAETKGHIAAIRTDRVGSCALLLGAGRRQKNDAVDPAVGIWMGVRLGDAVEPGDTLATFYVNDKTHLDAAIQRFRNAIVIGQSPPKSHSLIYETIE
ncbi:MAG: hypothetical protein MI862_12080, partial [Desulfobacterales bacterium]|nr:hypothetical protein [Desulfobacterales bacterium]